MTLNGFPRRPKWEPVLSLLMFFLLSGLSISADVTYLGAITEELNAPTALYVSSDVLAVLEPYSQELALYTPDGQVRERVQISGWVTGLQRLPGGEYLFCDRKERQVVMVDVNLGQQTVFLGSESLVDPTDILVVDNQVAILDANAKTLNMYSFDGTILSSIPLQDKLGASIGFPSALAFDRITGRHFVLDQTSSKIWTFSSAGVFVTTFSGYGSGSGDITRGGGIRCDNRGLLYVSDRYQGRVVVFNTIGEFVTNIDLTEFGGERLLTPIGVAADENDILYVSSMENASIHMFKVNGYDGGGDVLGVKQLLPLDRDTLPIGAVMFSVESFATADLLAEGVFDFEVFANGDTTAPVIQMNSIQPNDSLASRTGGAIAEWRVEWEFDPSETYTWHSRLRSAELVGRWSALRTFTISPLPRKFSLNQNYPNPFNPTTKIAFSLAHDAHVTIDVINILGQKVVTLVNEELLMGANQVIWDGSNANGAEVASGVYFYRMKAAEFNVTKKMVFLK